MNKPKRLRIPAKQNSSLNGVVRISVISEGETLIIVTKDRDSLIKFLDEAKDLIAEK